MIKKISIAVTFFFLLFSFSNALLAQEDGNQLQKARLDYTFQASIYNEEHADYLVSKNAYYQYGTIASRKQAVEDTKKVSIARAEYIRTYLQVLKLILIDQTYLDELLRKSQIGKIEATQAFIETHKSNMQNASSVTEVNQESKRYERESPAIGSLSWESISLKVIGDMQELYAETEKLYNAIKASQELPESQDVKEGKAEIEKQLSSARLIIDRAKIIINEYRSNTEADVLGAFNAIKEQAFGVRATLHRTTLLMQELETLKKDG